MCSEKTNDIGIVRPLLLMVCAAWLSAAAQQSSDVNTATVIRALEHEWVDAQARNDNRSLDLIFDNALVYVEYGKLVSKGEYLSRIRSAGPALSQIVAESMTVTTFANTAIVVGTYRELERKGGIPGVKRWRYVDTWAYKKNGWVLVAAAATPVLK